MKVAVLGEDLEDLAGLVGEEAVVRQDHGRPAAGLQDVRTCWTKLSCLLLVATVKSSRVGAWLAPLVPKGGLVRTTSNGRLSGAS